MGPGDRLALGIEAGRDAIIVTRPVHVVLDVFLAAPEHLHRAGDLFRDLHRPSDEIHLEPPAEAAAQEMVVHPDLGLRKPGHFGGGVLSEGRDLGSHPEVAAVRPDVDGAVHRLHRGVRKERLLVNRLDPLCCPGHRRGDVAVVASCCTMSAVERFAFGPSSQRMSSAARPCFAAHVSAATTATASSRRTTCRTPGMAFALASSTLASLPPNTGQAATAANFMPGSRTSMPNCAVPSTLSGVSSRFAGVPISLKSLGSLRATALGTGRSAARSTRAPYVRLRPVGPCITTPFAARHELRSTFQVWAAADTSMVRAVAPARRNGSQLPRTDVEPPVS